MSAGSCLRRRRRALAALRYSPPLIRLIAELFKTAGSRSPLMAASTIAEANSLSILVRCLTQTKLGAGAVERLAHRREVNVVEDV